MIPARFLGKLGMTFFLIDYAYLCATTYLLIQFTDNHFLIPRIVASKIRVNALMAIVGVLVGNAIGGVAGMFPALPVVAILHPEIASDQQNYSETVQVRFSRPGLSLPSASGQFIVSIVLLVNLKHLCVCILRIQSGGC